MRLLNELRYSQILMYPKASLINKVKGNLVVFEKDLRGFKKKFLKIVME